MAVGQRRGGGRGGLPGRGLCAHHIGGNFRHFASIVNAGTGLLEMLLSLIVNCKAIEAIDVFQYARGQEQIIISSLMNAQPCAVSPSAIFSSFPFFFRHIARYVTTMLLRGEIQHRLLL